MPHLVVIYGPPLSGKTSLARALAGRLEGSAAVVSTDALLHESIIGHARDAYVELEMVHTQARLLVANYLKNGYDTVLEGSFIYDVSGTLHHHEQEIDQILALMRNLSRAPLVVRLSTSERTLKLRAEALGRPAAGDAAARIAAAYRTRYGSRSIVLAADEREPADLASHVLDRLGFE